MFNESPLLIDYKKGEKLHKQKYLGNLMEYGGIHQIN